MLGVPPRLQLLTQPARPQTPSPEQAVLDRYCITCHNQKAKTGGLMLDTMDVSHPGANAATWEKVVLKIKAGLMPPGGMPRPDRRHAGRFYRQTRGFARRRRCGSNPIPERPACTG